MRVSRREFERLVLQAVESLPPAIRQRMDNLDVVVRDWPRPEHLEERGRGDRYSLLGLYQGVPLTERSHYDLALPDVITIFRHPIEALCATRREVVEEVRKTVLHEIAHHFGMDETALEKTKYT